MFRRCRIVPPTSAGAAQATPFGVCLTHGDLWPASVLLRGADVGSAERYADVNGQDTSVDGDEDEDEDEVACLIDWEMSHFGRPLQDCAHFLAHCIAADLRAGRGSIAGPWGDWDVTLELRALGGLFGHGGQVENEDEDAYDDEDDDDDEDEDADAGVAARPPQAQGSKTTLRPHVEAISRASAPSEQGERAHRKPYLHKIDGTAVPWFG